MEDYGWTGMQVSNMSHCTCNRCTLRSESLAFRASRPPRVRSANRGSARAEPFLPLSRVSSGEVFKMCGSWPSPCSPSRATGQSMRFEVNAPDDEGGKVETAPV